MGDIRVWQRWLWLTSLGLIVFGLGMALLNRTSIFDVFNRSIDPGFWPTGIPLGVSEFQGWVYGAWGATVAGWGLTAALVVRYGLARRERWAWWALVLGIAVWYILDTAISVRSRVWTNVGLNTVLLLAFAVPLAAGARAWLSEEGAAK